MKALGEQGLPRVKEYNTRSSISVFKVEDATTYMLNKIYMLIPYNTGGQEELGLERKRMWMFQFGSVRVCEVDSGFDGDKNNA